MTAPFVVQLASQSASPDDLARLAELAREAQAAGSEAVIVDDTGRGLDASVTIGFLAARVPDVRLVFAAGSGLNAPYNLARRVLSLHRETDGRAGVLIRRDGIDEITTRARALQEHIGFADAATQLADYLDVVSELWRSFPEEALVGDQEAGVFADADLVRTIGHDGPTYRVAGPLNVPTTGADAPTLYTEVEDGLDDLLVERGAEPRIVRRYVIERPGRLAALLADAGLVS
jgi:alkanesulfonate monooxygenase SsuD/methylene tetrahydromethanopterin reductase-like flavin-dependent oxidoreductase (luciferase family)